VIVFWDTNLFIYLFEPNGILSDAAEGLEQRMRERGDRLFTSTITLGELLVRARSEFDEHEVDRLRLGLGRVATMIPFDERAADHYASIRSRTTIKGPDALQLACAAASGADLFVTNDDRLSRRIVPGVGILCSLRGVPI
jgi:predicted nucleic acid-binding protein